MVAPSPHLAVTVLLLPLLLPAVSGQESDLSYSTLARSQEGRHFLVTTLLEKLYQPVSAPRYRGKVVFELPASLGGSADTESLAACCKLREVPFNHKSGRYTDKLLRQVLQKKGLLKYPKEAPIFDFDSQTKKDVMVLADMINGDQRPFDHMLSLAAAVKDLVNPNLFAKALVTITTRRTDVGMAVPNLAEVMSKEFLPNMAQLRRSMRQLDDGGRMEADQEIVVDWEDPQYRTYPEGEIENKLWYLREDPEVNSHHWYWHILFGNIDQFNTDQLQDRRGELFWYLHNQVCNRYNFERLSNGMPLVEGFGPDNWDSPIPLGYDPRLGDLSAVYYPPRRDNVHWYGHPESTQAHKRLVLNLLESIRKGYMTASNGTEVPLGVQDGREFGMDPIGAQVEQDPLRALNKELYGDIHNGGHKLMSQAGLHKQLTDAGIYNVVGNTATECRDPLLYRWHAYVDGIFGEYKRTLPDYEDEELDFPGLELEDVTVESFTAEDENTVSGRTYIKDMMFTHMEKGDVGFYGIDINNTFSDRVRIKYKRLSHSPFVYKLRVRNSGPSRRGLVRIFLADEQGTPTQIEMDKFIWTFKSGATEFERSYDSSSSVPRKPLSLYEIQTRSYEGVRNSEVDDPMINEYTGCGWAKHLLVPRGNPTGFETNLLVVISPLLEDDAAATTNWETVSSLSHSLCGAPGVKFPDSRPMGYPFDRSTYKDGNGWRSVMEGRTNMKRVGVTIVHQEECAVDRDCSSGTGCDQEQGRCNAQRRSGSQPQRRRRPRVVAPAMDSSCPSLVGTRPHIEVTKAGLLPSARECETRCRSDTDCANFEWHKVSRERQADSGRCYLYQAISLQPGHPTSTSGEKRCNDAAMEGAGTCMVRDQQPTLKYVRSWRRERGAEQCREKCAGEGACRYWEYQVAAVGDREGTCHAYAMSFRKR